MSRAAQQRNSSEHRLTARHEGNGPDFVCIGLQKAGTGWLHDVLQLEPDFWMPPIKELHFFDGHFKHAQARDLLRRLEEKPRALNRSRQRENLRPLGERDLVFLRRAAGRKKDMPALAWYGSLFDPKGELISGDITPGYSRLISSQIKEIAQSFPGLKVVLLIRDPVSRAWSQFNMSLRRRSLRALEKDTAPTNDQASPPIPLFSRIAKLARQSTARMSEPSPPDAFIDRTGSMAALTDFVQAQRLRSRAFPTKIHARWQQHFPAQQIHVDFFDDIVARPEEVRTRILAFLGGADRDVEGRFPLEFNRKEGQWKREMNDEAREFLVDFFRDELLRCAEVFGGPAEFWPRKYGLD